MKTNAARLLDRLEIAYELREYEVDDEHLDAASVAIKVGLDPACVFKTLVCRGERTGVCFAVVPATAELDLKALARLSGDRSAQTVPLKEVQPLTGYIRGGTTALAAKKDYPVFLDESAHTQARIAVSAGMRGLQIVLAPLDYVRAVRAKVGPLARF
jgi:Cys-tRNA(Pro)/Cys-tRNA(Cys) deacylase